MMTRRQRNIHSAGESTRSTKLTNMATTSKAKKTAAKKPAPKKKVVGKKK